MADPIKLVHPKTGDVANVDPRLEQRFRKMGYRDTNSAPARKGDSEDDSGNPGKAAN